MIVLLMVGCDDDSYSSGDVTIEVSNTTTPDTAPTDTADAGNTQDAEVQDTSSAPDTAVPETAPPDTTDPTPAADCSELGRDACIASADCVLEWSPEPGASPLYTCRDPQNICERRMQQDACEAIDACLWHPETCYCPEDANCYCSEGPSGLCRPAEELVVCDAVSGWGCSQRGACCLDEADAALGVCSLSGTCEVISPCDTLVSMRVTGGLCEFGPCEAALWVRSDGHVTLNTEAPHTPMDLTLDASEFAELATTLDELGRVRLAEGYGECCNASSDGSDDYITLHSLGAPVRTVRISNTNDLPEPLARLHQQLRWIAFSPEVSRNPAPGVWHPSELSLDDGVGMTCSDFEEAATWLYWCLTGPDGQQLCRERAIVADDALEELDDGMDAFVLEGVVRVNPDNKFALTTADGEVWTLAVEDVFGGHPGFVLHPRLIDGEQVRITARVSSTFWSFTLGLVIEGERGVLFMADDGLTNIHVIASSPFAVTVAGDCPMESDRSWRQGHTLQFSERGGGDPQHLELLTGQWGVWHMEGGYDLAVRNLRSYESGRFDDYWNYAYIAVPLAGSNVGECPGGRRP